jgi:hypothetical protein
LFQSCQGYQESTPSVGMSPPALQVLMRQVINEHWGSGFVTRNEMEARVTAASDQNVLDQCSGLSKQIGVVKRHISDPNGTLSKMEGVCVCVCVCVLVLRL